MLDNSLITKTGKVHSIVGTTHVQFSERCLKMPLREFLNGGVRVKINGETMAVESMRPLTGKQVDVINRMLRQNEIYCLVMDVAGQYQERNEYRRIKGIKNAIL